MSENTLVEVYCGCRTVVVDLANLWLFGLPKCMLCGQRGSVVQGSERPRTQEEEEAYQARAAVAMAEYAARDAARAADRERKAVEMREVFLRRPDLAATYASRFAEGSEEDLAGALLQAHPATFAFVYAGLEGCMRR